MLNNHYINQMIMINRIQNYSLELLHQSISIFPLKDAKKEV